MDASFSCLFFVQSFHIGSKLPVVPIDIILSFPKPQIIKDLGIQSTDFVVVVPKVPGIKGWMDQEAVVKCPNLHVFYLEDPRSPHQHTCQHFPGTAASSTGSYPSATCAGGGWWRLVQQKGVFFIIFLLLNAKGTCMKPGNAIHIVPFLKPHLFLFCIS